MCELYYFRVQGNIIPVVNSRGELYYFRVQGNIIPVVSSRGVKRRSTETPDISPAKQIKKEPEPVPMVNYLIEKYVPYMILLVHIL